MIQLFYSAAVQKKKMKLTENLIHSGKMVNLTLKMTEGSQL